MTNTTAPSKSKTRRTSSAPSRSKSLRSSIPPLDPSPQYLRRVPDGIMNPEIGRSVFFAMDLLGWLGDQGIDGRPTLIEIEAERARRGFRNLAVADDARATSARTVLPMFDGKAEARRNRARIAAATGGASAADFQRLSDEVLAA